MSDRGRLAVGAPRMDLPAPPIAREGWPIVAGFIIASAVLTALGLWALGNWGWLVAGVCLPLCVWCIWFFRDPPRRLPVSRVATGQASSPDSIDEPIISPADGVIVGIGPVSPPKELGLEPSIAQGTTRVSVFMNVFNVHVNRSPLAGVVEKVHYVPGKFFNASLDKASEHNERMSMVLQMPGGTRLVCVQIAGLIARRIVCRAKPGEQLAAGQRYGLIRFGSRVDVYLPSGVTPTVRMGERSVAGETVLGWLNQPLLAHPSSMQSSSAPAAVSGGTR